MSAASREAPLVLGGSDAAAVPGPITGEEITWSECSWPVLVQAFDWGAWVTS